MELGMAGVENSTPNCKHCITIPATASAFDEHRYPTTDFQKRKKVTGAILTYI
jgi:hypothetical protein